MVASGPAAAPLVRAVVVGGRGEAAGFVSVPWVHEQLRSHLGRDPFPGTLNLVAKDEASRAAWRARTTHGTADLLVAQEDGYCAASLYPAVVGDVPCVLVVPHVPGYPDDVLEVVAADRLRQRLGLCDGDEVLVSFRSSDSVEALLPPRA